MDVILTDFALQSYLDLKHRNVFSDAEYQEVLRPDAELLKDGFPSPHAKFNNDKFWGPGRDRSGNVIQHGYKMKWHNIGSGRVQLRLLVVIYDEAAFLCDAYVKSSDSVDRRFMAKLKIRVRDIALGNYVIRGTL